MTQFDTLVNVFFSEHVTSVGLTIMEGITNLLSPTFLSLIVLIGIVYCIFKKKWHSAIVVAVSVVGGLALGAIIKELVGRARPIGGLIVETGYSFPSGHAVMASIFFTLVICLLAPKIRSAVWRNLLIIASIILTLLGGISRLYLGVHWFSDVVAGICFGFLWTIIVVRYARVLLSSRKASVSREERG